MILSINCMGLENPHRGHKRLSMRSTPGQLASSEFDLRYLANGHDIVKLYMEINLICCN
jgi:hypothetical protein